MRSYGSILRSALVAAATLLLSGQAFAASALTSTPKAMTGLAAKLYYSQGDTNIHAMPTFQLAKRIAAEAPPMAKTATGSIYDLQYYGGPIMPSVTVYAIYWQPSKMQSGTSTIPFPALYMARQNTLLTNYPGHAIGAINTQYYQYINKKYTFISDYGGGFGGSYLDTHAFPAAGCSDAATPRNCLSDAQLQAEIKRVVSLKHWGTGLNHMVIIFTPRGMGSCMNSSSCAYTEFCAYHGSASNGAIIYANEPYGDANSCWDGGPAPSGDVMTDSTSDTVSHELTEAITDPLVAMNKLSWYNQYRGEIGDLCNFTFGYSGWDNGQANQMWAGNYYRIQQEWSNFQSSCTSVGP